MLKITKERLRQIIVEAYENGWSGCPELKEEYAELIVEGMDEENDVSSSFSISASSAGDLVSQHYSYCGYNVSGGTVLVNDPEEEI